MSISNLQSASWLNAQLKSLKVEDITVYEFLQANSLQVDTGAVFMDDVNVRGNLNMGNGNTAYSLPNQKGGVGQVLAIADNFGNLQWANNGGGTGGNVNNVSASGSNIVVNPNIGNVMVSLNNNLTVSGITSDYLTVNQMMYGSSVDLTSGTSSVVLSGAEGLTMSYGGYTSKLNASNLTVDSLDVSGMTVDDVLQVGSALGFDNSYPTNITAVLDSNSSAHNLVCQNLSTGNTASTNIYLTNDGTITESGNYAVIGLNGHNYTGSDYITDGKDQLYISNTDKDIALAVNFIGSGAGIHFSGNGGVSAISVGPNNALSVNTTYDASTDTHTYDYGVSGEVLMSQGNAPPIWTTVGSSTGTIEQITSTLGTLTITNPNGPITNIELPVINANAGLHSYASINVDQYGRITSCSSGIGPLTAVASGSNITPDGLAPAGTAKFDLNTDISGLTSVSTQQLILNGVDISGTAQTGYVIKATSPTSATWQPDSTGGGAVNSVVADGSNIIIDPPAGTGDITVGLSATISGLISLTTQNLNVKTTSSQIYSLPTTMPTTGQYITNTGSPDLLQWANLPVQGISVSGPITSTGGFTPTIGFNSNNLSLTNTTINGVQMPTTAGSTNQILKLTSPTTAIWDDDDNTGAVSSVEASGNNIQIPNTTGAITVALNTNLTGLQQITSTNMNTNFLSINNLQYPTGAPTTNKQFITLNTSTPNTLNWQQLPVQSVNTGSNITVDNTTNPNNPIVNLNSDISGINYIKAFSNNDMIVSFDATTSSPFGSENIGIFNANYVAGNIITEEYIRSYDTNGHCQIAFSGLQCLNLNADCSSAMTAESISFYDSSNNPTITIDGTTTQIILGDDIGSNGYVIASQAGGVNVWADPQLLVSQTWVEGTANFYFAMNNVFQTASVASCPVSLYRVCNMLNIKLNIAAIPVAMYNTSSNNCDSLIISIPPPIGFTGNLASNGEVMIAQKVNVCFFGSASLIESNFGAFYYGSVSVMTDPATANLWIKIMIDNDTYPVGSQYGKSFSKFSYSALGISRLYNETYGYYLYTPTNLIFTVPTI